MSIFVCVVTAALHGNSLLGVSHLQLLKPYFVQLEGSNVS